MRSAAVLALLLCAGQVSALPVNSPVNKRDTEVMKCIVEVISDTLSKPSPMPVSQECFETLRGDERILSILRHQNLLKELQDLALQGAKERAQQQKKHSSFEEELSEVLEQQNDQDGPKEGTEEMSSKDAAEGRGDPGEVERNGGDTDGAGPQAPPEPGQGSTAEEDDQAPGEEEEAANTHPPASPPSQKRPGPQTEGDNEGPSQGLVDRAKGLGAEPGEQAKREEEEEDPEAGEKVVSEEEGPTAASDPHPSLGYKEALRAESPPEALAVDGGGKTGAEEAQEGARAQSPQEEEEEMAGAPPGPLRGGKSREQQQEQEFSKEWEEAKRWSKMEQLARELTAEKRLAGEDGEDAGPDRSVQLSYQARDYGFGGPGLRGWRPSPQEDTVEAGLPLRGRGYPEEKKEEEGSANRRPEDQELESLSAIEAELEKVAHQLQALRRG